MFAIPTLAVILISSLLIICVLLCNCFFYFLCFLFHCSACSSSAVFSECCHHSPVQSAVVLKNPHCQSSLTQGVTVTVICQDTLHAAKRNSRGQDRGQALRSAKNVKPTRTLKFTKSLNDVDQKAQSTSECFDYVERTCSEGKLTPTQEQCLRINKFQLKERKSLNLRPLAFSNSKHSYIPSLSNYSSASGGAENRSAVHIPLLEDRVDHDTSRSKKLLRYLFSFSHTSSTSSLHKFHELESYSSHFQAEKSSSMLVESTDFCSEDMGDDDVFEDSTSMKLRTKEQRAPLCSVEKDSDLDCPSPLSEKFPPLSPVSASGDTCRLVHRRTAYLRALLCAVVTVLLSLPLCCLSFFSTLSPRFNMCNVKHATFSLLSCTPLTHLTSLLSKSLSLEVK